jgi:hypothetical protein
LLPSAASEYARGYPGKASFSGTCHEASPIQNPVEFEETLHEPSAAPLHRCPDAGLLACSTATEHIRRVLGVGESEHAPAGTGPISVTTIASSISHAVRGGAGSGFIWATSPGPALGAGIPFLGGFVDLNIVAGLTILADGISFSTGSWVDFLANTGPTGVATFAFPVCNAFFLIPRTHQCAVVDPSSPFGATLTAATTLNLTCGISTPLSLTDDSTVFVAHGSFCPNTVFYNTSYTGIFVNSNGNVTFGLGDTVYTESQSLFNTGRPRLALCWDDFNPATGGTITYLEGATGWRVDYVNVPEFAAIGNLQTCSVQYDCATGSITFTYGSMATPDGLVGITPGLSLASPVTTFPSLKPVLCGGSFAGHPAVGLESINALYVTGFDLAGCTLSFLPGTFGGPGSALANSYLAL